MNQTAPPATSRILCVWLPNWPVQRIQAETPELGSAPLILANRDARRGMVVAAANLSARAAGVRPQMRMSEASALTASTPGSTVHPFELQEDLDGMLHLSESAQRFSPIVGLEQLDKKAWFGRTLLQPECILLDVTGIGSLFGGEAELATSVCRWLSGQGLFGCVALSNSIGSAWALANYNLRSSASGTQVAAAAAEPNVPSESSLPSQKNEPTEDVERANTPHSMPNSRYLIVEPGQEELATARLPIAALRLSTETIVALRRLGVTHVGQLRQLPRSGITSRLGDQLLVRWDQLLGHQAESIVTEAALPEWTVEFDIEHPTEDHATIEAILSQLCTELCSRLAKRGEGAIRVLCRLEMRESLPLIMQLGLFRPTNDAGHLQLLLTGQLEQQFRHGLTHPVSKISLQASLTAEIQWRQGDLFDDGDSANRREMASLVDSLSARLGRKSVMRIKVNREAQPEQAYSLEPMTGRRNDGREQQGGRKLSSRLATRRAEPSRTDPLRRPSHLLKPPAPITVRYIESTDVTTPASTDLEDGESPKQLQFRYNASWYSVVAQRGPERLESGWWRGPSARRDYYTAVTTDGSWWWIYRDMSTNAWFLHGRFD